MKLKHLLAVYGGDENKAIHIIVDFDWKGEITESAETFSLRKKDIDRFSNELPVKSFRTLGDVLYVTVTKQVLYKPLWVEKGAKE